MDIFLETALRAHPEREAVVSSSGTLTYDALYRDVMHMRDALKAQGKGRVLLYGRKSPEMLEAMLACLLAGRTYIPADENIPSQRLEAIIEQAEPSLCITDLPFPYDIPHASVLALDTLAPVQDEPSEDAYILFTSGSTGIPKGVVITRENLASFIRWVSALPALRKEHTHVLNQASFAFDLSVGDIFYALCNGHTLHLLTSGYPDFYPFLKDIEVMFITPAFMKLLLSDPSFRQENFPRLSVIFFCGEQLLPSLVKKIRSRFGCTILNAYGPTEACCAVCASEISADMTERDLLPCGDLDTAAVGIEIEADEIILKGNSVGKGYLHGRTFDHVFATGDIGEIINSRLYCHGRKDRQIKYKGFRIELDEIEEVLLQTEKVQDCAVAASRNADGTVTRLHAYLVSSAESSDILACLQNKLPAYMIPILHFVDEIPRNDNQKTDRKALYEKDS